VKLGPVLDEMVVRNREKTTVDEQGKTAVENYFAGNTTFPHHEKKLWYANLSDSTTQDM